MQALAKYGANSCSLATARYSQQAEVPVLPSISGAFMNKSRHPVTAERLSATWEIEVSRTGDKKAPLVGGAFVCLKQSID